ncbi:MAG: glycogen debranching protein [Armatimonadetes bacterium]|nr:glycogen debranching protein [Armatimonadota bacterium]
MPKSNLKKVDEKAVLIEEAFNKAKTVLDKCSTPNGLFASPTYYNAIYARDALISSLGGLVSGEDRYAQQWLKTMDTLMDRQATSGQIPNCVDTFVPSRPRLIAFGAADASLWFVLTLAYAEQLIGKRPEFHEAANQAMAWLSYQDAHEDGLIEQQEATDWMDIIDNRGHVLYTNVLYFAALELHGDIKRAHLVREGINGYLWNAELGYFRPYAWKQEHGDWFDTAANLFAVAFGLADDEQASTIFDYIDRHHLYEPRPIRTMHPPIQPGDKDWREYYRTEHELNMPDQYHNGGSWPWVGGLYVAALVRARRLDQAKDVLHRLALTNREGRDHEWEFNEWFHGITGEPRGATDQCWSAGMYVYGYCCVKDGREPVFGTLESNETQLLHNTPPSGPTHV